ncbi:MAG TPA: hypothetical protein EYQ74_01145 [Planctomycetes bacterium]|nr:hypothetical protein [Planctomycetota bacterium]HIK59564.1 hypothetical protein [Planctomycetota bacterium]
MSLRLIKNLAIVLLSLLCLLGLALSIIPGRARALLRESSESALGVPATVGTLDTSLSGSNLDLGIVNFDVQNPAGFDGAPLLHLGRVTCNLRLPSLLTGTVGVDQLVVENLRLRIVQEGSRSNIAPLLKKIAQGLRDPNPDEPEDQSAPVDPGPGPRLDLKSLTLRGVGIDLELTGLGNLNVQESATLPDWTLPLEGVRAPDGGAPTLDDILAHLLDQLHARALVAAEEFVPKELLPLLHGASTEDLIRDGLERELLDLLPANARDELKGKAAKKLRGLLRDR